MKKLLISTVLLIFTLTVGAIPAKKVWKTVRQSDGTQVKLMLVGDENFHCYRTTDGLPVVEQQGCYFYAKVVNDKLEQTDMLAHDIQQRSDAEKVFAANLCTQQQLDEAIRKAPRVTRPRAPKRIGEATGDFTGSKKGLIILVQYKDQPFAFDNIVELYQDIANKEGYTNSLGAIGSVHDYFLKQSGGVFDLTFDVAGPYTTPNVMSYYGQNNYSGQDRPERVRELIRFAITAANEDVNYSDYDWDGDGEVDQVFVLYSGYAESAGASSNTIWPHESQLFSYSMFFDGVTINTYACSEELEGDGSEAGNPDYVPQLNGLGTICHEFSHCLGLPDFYDTASNHTGAEGQYGMGFWDVMDSGCYNYNGWVPSNYSGYERNFCGWTSYRELTQPCKVTGLKNVDIGGETYVIYNPGNHNEYYLMENRAKTGWDRGLEGTGLLIYHVNYVADRWRYNTVNTTGYGKPCMNPVPADNVLSLYVFDDNGDPIAYGDAGDPWPNWREENGKRVSVNTLSDTSTPACTLHTANSDGSYLLHAKIKVTKRGGVIDLVYNDGTEPWSEATGIQEITDNTSADIIGKKAQVYSVNGTQVMSTDNFTGNEPLLPGLYVVRTADGQSQKVLIPAK